MYLFEVADQKEYIKVFSKSDNKGNDWVYSGDSNSIPKSYLACKVLSLIDYSKKRSLCYIDSNIKCDTISEQIGFF